MEALVGKSSSNLPPVVSSSNQATINKRKIRSDVTQCDLAVIDSLVRDNFPRQYWVENHGENGVCEVCGDCETCVSVKHEPELPSAGESGRSPVAGSCADKEEADPFTTERTDWDESAESELKKLVLSLMDVTFKSAMKKIVDCGYSEEVALKTMMRPDLVYGSNDAVSNIVENGLAFIKTCKDMDRARCYFKNLDELENYLVREFVYVLQAARPFFSAADALWYLLVFDMDISHACFVVSGNYKLREELHTNERSSAFPQNQLLTEGRMLDVYSKRSHVLERKGSKIGGTQIVDESFGVSEASKIPEAGREMGCSRKSHDPGPLKKKSTLSNKSQGYEGARKIRTIMSNDMRSLPLPSVSRLVGSSSSEVELSCSLKMIEEPIEESDVRCSGINSLNNSGYPVKDTKLQLFNLDQKDETISIIFSRVQSLQNQLDDWTEWANMRVLQATHRLLKHKPELNTLRREKGDVERLDKEKQLLMDNTTKKFSDLENALRKMSRQVGAANRTFETLEVENTALRQQMEVAKSLGVKAASSCQEALERETMASKNMQTAVKQKNFLQEELNAEKHKCTQALQELSQARVILSQLQAKVEKESKEKEELLQQASKIRKEIEHHEASEKAKAGAMICKAESALLKYKEDMQELEGEISKLRVTSESSKIAALRNGVHKSHASKISNKKKSLTHPEATVSGVSKNAHDSRNTNAALRVKRHRECVMCLSEEMSVVFLPCAHQVLCAKCNEQHEKKGMKDCPSCRSTIMRRIVVCYATP